MDETYCIYKGQAYKVIVPQADTDELSKKGNRLMLIHKHHGEPVFGIAIKDVLTHGIAIGLFL